MKKLLALVFALVMLFSVTAIAEPITLQIGFENSMSEPIGQALAKWQELVAAQGDGSLVIELFPDSQLGNKTDLIDQMLLGEPVMTLADGAFFADYGVPDMGIVFGPFLFENWDQCWTLIESDWWNEQCAQLEALGLKMVAANWAYGARHTLTTKQVKTPADLAGLQIAHGVYRTAAQYAAAILIVLISLFPIYWMVISSLKTSDELMASQGGSYHSRVRLPVGLPS